MIVGLTTIIFAVQLILYYAVYYVQSLTKKSAGLNHHLRFRKTQLMNDYFPDYILFILSVVIVLAAIAFLIGYFKSQKNTWLRLSLGWLIVCSILSILFIYLPYFTDSLAYPYWIIIGLVNAVYSWLIFLLVKKIR